MILFTTCISVFVTCLAIIITCYFIDCREEVFVISMILLMASGIGMVASSGSIKPDIKAIEYPASEYNFKIKIVELEEQRDTILVVTPKEKIK